ncbi:hydrogenase maturation protease [Kaarinaea lacus]
MNNDIGYGVILNQQSKMPAPNVDNVILGLGNKALSDDAVGVKVVRHILKKFPELTSVHIIDGSHLNYELTTVLENAQNFVVIYAATLNQSPGTISTLVGSDMDRILKRPQRNANETALADLFEIAKLAKQLPAHRAVITIEPKKTTWGNRMSACVSKAIPQLAENALTLMAQWTGKSIHAPITTSTATPPAPTQRTDP